MEIFVRLAVAGDREAVEAIVRSAYAPYIARIGRPPAPMLDDYGELIARGRVHVAEIDGAVGGLLVLLPQTDAMLLDNIAVASSLRGQGVGRRLLEFAEGCAREAGYQTIKLYTNEAMSENIALYGRIGYLETHRSEEKNLRRVYMAKALGA